MSFGLYWEPAQPTKGISLPVGLKYILAKRFFEHDGTLRGDVFLGPGHASYLEGVRDAATSHEVRQGAEALLEAIDKHKTIRVWIGEEDD